MKFILGENLHKLGKGYAGVQKCKFSELKEGDLWGHYITSPNKSRSIIYSRLPDPSTIPENRFSNTECYKVVWCSSNLHLDYPKAEIPDTEIEFLLHEYHEKLRRNDIIKGGQVVSVPRSSIERNYQVQGFEDGYNKAKEHFNILGKRNIVEIELQDDVWECPGKCEEPDEHSLYDDGCKKSYVIPYVVDNKVVVKNIVYDGTV